MSESFSSGSVFWSSTKLERTAIHFVTKPYNKSLINLVCSVCRGTCTKNLRQYTAHSVNKSLILLRLNLLANLSNTYECIYDVNITRHKTDCAQSIQLAAEESSVDKHKYTYLSNQNTSPLFSGLSRGLLA